MPFLRVEHGSCPGQLLEVNGDRVVLGRHPGCGIVLDNAAVSRQHAQICESHGGYFLEDLRSRNHTYLNGAPVSGTAELHDRDVVQVCDLTFRFFLSAPGDGNDLTISPAADKAAVTPPAGLRVPVPQAETGEQVLPPAAKTDEHDADHEAGGSSILGTVPLDEASGFLLAVKPEQKLRAVLDIGKALANTLELNAVLGRTLDGLFRVFPQADHGFVLLKEGEAGKLQVRVSKSRREGESPAGVSMTVVRRAMKAGEAVLSADVIGDERFSSSESLPSLSMRSVMCVPLLAQDKTSFGVVQLDCGDVSRPFGRDDLDTLASVAGQIGLAVENARLHAELVTQRDLRRELDFAMQVQLGFLPSQPPVVPGYEFCDHYEAAFRVGGDYFDYIEFTDGRVAVTIGDVAGKGVPAALLMARLFSSARYQLLTRPTPGAAMQALNAEIARTALGHRFITCIFCVLDPKAQTLTIANAGHMAPLIRTAEGETAPFGQKDSGQPVGIDMNQEFVEVVYHIAPGDTVLLYTDGVTEAMNAAQDLYGRRRLTALVSSGPQPIRALVERIVSEVAIFMADSHQRDDMCLVGFRRLV